MRHSSFWFNCLSVCVLCGAALTLLSACANSQASTPAVPLVAASPTFTARTPVSGTPHAGTPASGTPSAITSGTFTVPLKHTPQGKALLTWEPTSRQLSVNSLLTGLAPKSTHPAEIRSGDCKTPGKTLHGLSNIMADDKGNAKATSQVSGVTGGIPANGWVMVVHNGPGNNSTNERLPIACAAITNAHTATNTAQHVTANLNSSATPGESATGNAEMTLKNDTLTVKLTMTSLTPNTSYDAQIHKGYCSSQGDVAYPLQPVKADAKGNGTSTTTIHNVSSIPGQGRYISVRSSANANSKTGVNPIACGNIIQHH